MTSRAFALGVCWHWDAFWLEVVARAAGHHQDARAPSNQVLHGTAGRQKKSLTNDVRGARGCKVVACSRGCTSVHARLGTITNMLIVIVLSIHILIIVVVTIAINIIIIGICVVLRQWRGKRRIRSSPLCPTLRVASCWCAGLGDLLLLCASIIIKWLCALCVGLVVRCGGVR